MILSVSRRTDIPGLYAGWFMERIRQGYVCVRNPFNPRVIKRYNIGPDSVDLIVFWSKNPAPLIQYLDELDSLGYKYYFQFTLNDYPEFIEPKVPPLEYRLNTFKELSRRVGASSVVWRYDPIILSSVTDVHCHAERIEAIARALQGHTERLVISFLDFYRKILPRLQRLSQEHSVTISDVTAPAQRQELEALAAAIAGICRHYGIHVYTCAEKLDLSRFGIQRGACIDPALIRRMLGSRPVNCPKDRGQRSACLCARSVDVGAYNTCLHECVYCYANYSHKVIVSNMEKHRRDSPLLVGT